MRQRWKTQEDGGGLRRAEGREKGGGVERNRRGEGSEERCQDRRGISHGVFQLDSSLKPLKGAAV